MATDDFTPASSNLLHFVPVAGRYMQGTRKGTSQPQTADIQELRDGH